MKAIIFDMDYTLLDREHAIRTIATDQLSAHFPTHQLRSQAVDAFIERDRDGFSDRREVYSHVAEEFDTSLPIDRLFHDFNRRAWSYARLFDGVGELLIALRNKGIPLGILTNGSFSAQDAKLNAVGLKEMVDVVFIAGEHDVWKPSAAAFHGVCEQLATLPCDTVMVGDTPDMDIIPATELGMRTVWVRSHHRWPTDVPEVFTITVENVSAATDTLISWCGKDWRDTCV